MEKMDQKSQYLIRVQNCIGTIIDVHNSICSEYHNNELLLHFEELKQTIDDLDMSLVSEGDVLMVEQATNVLLGEFKKFFKCGEFAPVYEEKLS